MPTSRDIPRFLVAGILLVAASLKAHELATNPALGTLFGSRWPQFGLIEYELLLGSWLLSGIAQDYCRKVALATFAGFGCYAFYLGVTGAASCGCFGRVQINPWWMFGFDCVAAVTIWKWKPSITDAFRSRASVVVAVFALGALPFVSLITRSGSASAVDGIVMGDAYILLEPEKWIGKQFPLEEQIDIGDQLMLGSWRVLFYHHDCPRCQEALDLIGERSNDEHESAIALIDVPPFGDSRIVANGHHGRLRDDVQWFVATPVEVALNDGKVTAVVSQGTLLSTDPALTVD